MRASSESTMMRQVVSIVGLTLSIFSLSCARDVDAAEPVAKPTSPNPLVKILQPVPDGTRVDHSGDPLPTGMVQRLGGTRFKVEGWWRQFAFAGNDEWIWMKANDRLSLIHRESGRVIEQPQLRLGTDYIRNLSVGASGRRVAVDMSDVMPDSNGETTIRVVIISAITTSQIQTITWKSRSGGLSRLSYSDDGEKLLAVTHRDELKIWNVESGELAKDLTLQPTGIRVTAISHDNRFCLLGSFQRAHLWEIGKDEAPVKLPVNNVGAVCFAPNGRQCAVIGNQGVILFDTESGKQIAQLAGDDKTRRINADFGASFSPDGKLITVPISSSDTVEIWDVESRSRVAALPVSRPRGAVFSQNGRWIAAAGDDSQIRIFDWPSQKQVSRPSVGHDNSVSTVCFIDDDSLFSGGDDARIWDIPSGEQQQQLSHTRGVWVRGLAVSPERDTLVTMGFDDAIGVWDRATGRQRAKLPGHGRTGAVRFAKFNADGSQFLSWGDDAVLRRWDVKSATLIASHQLDIPGYRHDPKQFGGQIPAQALSTEALFVAAGTHFFEFDPATSQQRRTAQWDRQVQALAISDDGRWIATGERKVTQNGFDTPTVIVLRDRVTLEIVREWPVIDLQDRTTPADDDDERKLRHRVPSIVASTGLVFSPDSKSLAWSRVGIHNAIDVIHIDQDEPYVTIPLDSASWHFQFSPDGNKIAAGSADSTISIWDWQNPVFANSPAFTKKDDKASP